MKKKMNLKKGDFVVVISGEDKGKKGQILKAFPSKGRVIVEKVNLIKKHSKPSQTNPQGGIITKEAPIDASNVQLVDPETGESSRIGYKEEDGKKVRYFKKSGNTL